MAKFIPFNPTDKYTVAFVRVRLCLYLLFAAGMAWGCAVVCAWRRPHHVHRGFCQGGLDLTGKRTPCRLLDTVDLWPAQPTVPCIITRPPHVSLFVSRTTRPARSRA